jgi:hypothetical protein
MKDFYQKEECTMNSSREKTTPLSRRSFITKAGIFLAGGLAAHGSGLASTTDQAAAIPPPLPWKWVKLDPLEAGRRAYRSYLEKKG